MAEDKRIDTLKEMREKASIGGGLARIEKQHAKGKLTARERIEILLDKGSFQELEPYTSQRKDVLGGVTEEIYGDGVVTGYGEIDGRTVYVYAQDFTVQGGALGEMQSRKICRAMDLAAKNGSPIVGMIDSGGARIQEGVNSLGGYGEIFRRNAIYSGVVPQISLVLGPCAGGAAYSPAVTDFIIMVENQSYMFLTGPEVIKSVTGEEIDFEGLGGSAVHLGTSGTSHLTCKDEHEALVLCRKLLGYLPSNNVENAPVVACDDSIHRVEAALDGMVPEDPGMAYNMHQVIDLIVDRGSFLETQKTFAQNAIVGLARLNGSTVGIVAQEPAVMAGVMDIDSADKIARFVRFCDAFNIPLVTFVDSPGFLPGVDQEHRGVIRHGAKVLFAYSEATVPKVSIVTRKAYGGAYVVMSSKYMGSDINYAWPSAEIAVMGPDGAANILYGKQIKASDDPAAERKRITEEYRRDYLNPYTAARSGYIDDVIAPQETRAKVIKALTALRNKQEMLPPRKHGNIPL